MSNVQADFTWHQKTRLCMILPPALILMTAPSIVANSGSSDLPAKVIAHLPLQDPAGSEMLLQSNGAKRYLYVQKVSRQSFTVVDVTKPTVPILVNPRAPSRDDAAGKLEIVGSDVGVAEVPDKKPNGTIQSTDNPTKTVKILDLSDPSSPKVIQTFTGVVSTLQDPARGLIYLANSEGLWILRYLRPGFTPAKNKRPCGSEDAISAMPPDCQ